MDEGEKERLRGLVSRYEADIARLESMLDDCEQDDWDWLQSNLKCSRELREFALSRLAESPIGD